MTPEVFDKAYNQELWTLLRQNSTNQLQDNPDRVLHFLKYLLVLQIPKQKKDLSAAYVNKNYLQVEPKYLQLQINTVLNLPG